MGKYYVGYIEFGNKGKIESAMLGEFESNKLTKIEKQELFDWHEDDDAMPETFLDSLQIDYVYYAVDTVENPSGDIFINENLNDNWPVYVENTYTNIADAKKAFLRDGHKVYKTDSVEKLQLILTFEYIG
jgi:hypothetical protein